MRVRLALVGCTAFCLGVPALAVATPQPAPVQPAAAVQVHSPAAMTAENKRYRLTMTYTAELESGGPHEYCGWGSPIYPAEGLIWVCSSDYNEHHQVRTYAAKSVRPFTFKRLGKYYTFTTRMKGTAQQVGGYSAWSHHWIGGEGYHDATVSGGLAANSKVSGKVYLNGATPARVITNMTATEDPSANETAYTCSDGTCTTATYPFPSGFSDRAWLKRVNLRKAFGKPFTVTTRRTTPPLAINGTTTREKWHFRFTPVAKPVKKERWQVEVRGRDRWSWGMFTGLRAGVDVEWAHRTTLVLKNDKITSAKGAVHILKVGKFSEPPGAFDVTTYTATVPPRYNVKAVKHGKKVTLKLWKNNRSEYRVDFAVAAAGPALLEKLRSIGVADPEGTYLALLARGPVEDSAAPLVPTDPRLVVALKPQTYNLPTEQFAEHLPCTRYGADEQDCFLVKGGQVVTVTQLK